MKILYIPAKNKIPLSISNLKSKIKKLPNKIGLISTVQFSDIIPKIASIIRLENKIPVFYKKPIILGCDLKAGVKIQNKVDCFLYIGSGRFHPIALSLSLKKEIPIFVFNPNTNTFKKLDYREVQKMKRRQKAAYIRYLSKNEIGILVSTKQGQCNLKQALSLKKDIEEKGKKAYIFLTDHFSEHQLENWPNLAWINTMCPGLSREMPSRLLDFRNIKK